MTHSTNADAPAYPTEVEVWEDGPDGIRRYGGVVERTGLTKREEFAKAAMQGMLANPDLALHSEESTANMAVMQADALLEALAVRS